MPDQSGIDVKVHVGDACPELLRDLSQRDKRARADRLRTLATVGLAMLNGQAVSPPPAPVAPPRHPERMKGVVERLSLSMSDGKKCPM